MIYYKCDACQKEIKPNEIKTIEKFPRCIKTCVVGHYGERFVRFDSYKLSKTHLCNNCFIRIANMLIVGEEEDETL